MREKYRGRFQGRMMHINRKYRLRKYCLTPQTFCHNSSESRWDAGQAFKEENLHGECRFTQISSLLPTLRCHTSLCFRAEYLLPPAQKCEIQKMANCQILEFYNLLLSLQKPRQAKVFVRVFLVCFLFCFQSCIMHGRVFEDQKHGSFCTPLHEERKVIVLKETSKLICYKTASASDQYFYLYHLLRDSP